MFFLHLGPAEESSLNPQKGMVVKPTPESKRTRADTGSAFYLGITSKSARVRQSGSRMRFNISHEYHDGGCLGCTVFTVAAIVWGEKLCPLACPLWSALGVLSLIHI